MKWTVTSRRDRSHRAARDSISLDRPRPMDSPESRRRVPATWPLLLVAAVVSFVIVACAIVLFSPPDASQVPPTFFLLPPAIELVGTALIGVPLLWMGLRFRARRVWSFIALGAVSGLVQWEIFDAAVNAGVPFDLNSILLAALLGAAINAIYWVSFVSASIGSWGSRFAVSTAVTVIAVVAVAQLMWHSPRLFAVVRCSLSVVS